MVQYDYHISPVGTIRICCEGDSIISIHLHNGPAVISNPSPAAALACRQLQEYFEGKRSVFELPLKPVGTPFQLAVWEELCQIPYGQTRTYGQIARAIGKPKATRAVGMACNRNPLWIVVPCHRVVGCKGLTGYAGGLPMKRSLLELEQSG